MIDPDFLRLVKLGALVLEMETLERGGIPSNAPAPAADLSNTEIARRAAFLAEVGRRAIENARSPVSETRGRT